MGSYLKLKDILEESERFVLIGHEHPDGDCLGAVLAMGAVLCVCYGIAIAPQDLSHVCKIIAEHCVHF
jgi:nanoRNase/pAp phosphatase (c-di-AMP/oligoRNAs hydrolase)